MAARARLSTIVAACLVLSGLALPAAAQITTGTVTGTVKDQQGGVIPGATVMLISETQQTKSVPVVTSESGDFVFPNVPADDYTVRVEMPSFKTLNQSGISVSPGSRVAIGTLVMQVGGTSEVIEVKGESPAIQATTGERSFTVTTDEVANLPLADRNFATLASLAPGVEGTGRIGGGGATNFMLDGVSTMDTGSNRLLMAVNVESIAAVKVLTSNYQAEYGRSSGLQITAVTKSGTNRYHGGIYTVERNSDWNANSKTNKLNYDPKTISRQRDWGFSFGGPVGRPGGTNKLFFYYTQEFQPREGGLNVVRYRLPTALERTGDFSQTYDNNGNPFPWIRDVSSGLPCSTSATGNHSGCFQDGGVFGRIPADRLYQTGLNILRMWPLPNINGAGLPYNFELTRPTEHLLAYQPAIRFDYQARKDLRVDYKYTGWRQRKQTINGSIPGFNDTRMQNPVVSRWGINVNYTLNRTTFLEGTYGRSQNEQAGCALTGNGANFCTSALPMNPVSNRSTAGLGALPFLFPDANVINPRYYAIEALNAVQPPIWDGTQLFMPPSFNWGGRVSGNNPNYAPPNIPFPGFLNVNRTQDVAISLTKVLGRHTMKTGFYNTHSYKAQQRTGSFGTLSFNNDGNNPIDSQFGFSNAALGIFTTYQQASKYIEGVFLYNNTEGYIQDNWRVSRRMTLDYGVRLVHQQPQYDSLGQAANFLPEKWSPASAPYLYVAGCTSTPAPGTACPAANRQAVDPRNGQFLGANTTLGIAALIPNSGDTMNGLFLSGQGIVKTTYKWPALAAAPRFGMAYDLTGTQRFVLRGGTGLFFDRPDGNAIFSQVSNPPSSRDITVRYGTLQTLGTSGLTTEGPPTLSVYKYDSRLPSSVQWNAGMQMALPWWAMTVDVSYVGHHSYNLLTSVNLNAIDFGTAYLPENQDPTLVSTTPGGAARSTDLLRPFRGYGAINQQWDRNWSTYHSLQWNIQRRFRNGVSFGFNDTMGLSNTGSAGARLQHNPDGSYFIRDDQKKADDLLGGSRPRTHIMKANFVWDLPDLRRKQGVLAAVAHVVNDWQLSGIWTGSTGATYSIGFGYQSGFGAVNLTGSPDYNARALVVGDPGSGCSRDIYRQFNTAAFQGPGYRSDGLESSNDYMNGCLSSVLDLAIARNIRFGKGRTIQVRVDMFNAPNAARITGRQTTMNLTNPGDPVTITNLAFDPITGLLNDGVNLLSNGNVSPNRSLPRNAGFGVANGYQGPRSIQGQIRFSF